MYVLKSATNGDGGINIAAHPNRNMQIRAISHVV
jgi:hypothetical protein